MIPASPQAFVFTAETGGLFLLDEIQSDAPHAREVFGAVSFSALNERPNERYDVDSTSKI